MFKEDVTQYCKNCHKLQEENERLRGMLQPVCKELREMTQAYEDYADCLAEIKEICKKEVICDDCELQGTNKCDARMCTNFYLNDFADEILQKIAECEVK